MSATTPLLTPTPAPTSTPSHHGRSLWRAAMVPSGIALVAAAAVFGLADIGLDGVWARRGSAAVEPVLLAHVLGSTVMGASAAVLLAWASRRFASRPRRTFVTSATVGTILYSTMPFFATDDLGSAVALVALHVVVAVPLVLGLRGQLAAQR